MRDLLASSRDARYSTTDAAQRANPRPVRRMRLGVGCVNLGSAGGRSTRADVRLVHEAIDLGIGVFDTADAYGNGASERVLGRALASSRDDVVIATKGGYLFRERTGVEQGARRVAGAVLRRASRRVPVGAGTPSGSTGSYRQRDLSASHLRAAVEGSLRRLRTDRIDLYQLHGPQEVEADLFDELVDLRTAGKVLAFGIGAESVAAAVAWLAVPAVACVQVPFGVLDPEAASLLFPLLAERPAEVWARGVLGGGLLAAAERDPAAAAADPKAPTIDALRRLATETGVGIDELAVDFVRTYPSVSTILVGISSSAHLRRNLALMTAPPPDDDVVAGIRAIAGSAPGAPVVGT
jgi:D-threo-aldose 1-dehydrogenase